MTNWIDLYFNYKKSLTFLYSKYLMDIISINKKNYLNEKRRSEDLFKNVIDYIFKYNYDNKYDKYKLFFNSGVIPKYNLQYEVRPVIDYFVNEGKAFIIKENIDDIILAGVIVKIALELSDYKNDDVYNYVTDLITKYHEISFTELVDNKKTKTKELSALIRNNIKHEKEFLYTFKNSNSFNKYIKINKTNNFYISQYNYFIKELETYDNQAIKMVYKNNSYSDDFTFISSEISQITLLNLFNANSSLINILMPVNNAFLSNDKNIKNIEPIFKTNYNIDNLHLLIRYNDLDSNLISKLKKRNINYYIYCDETSEVVNFKDELKYLLSRTFIKKHGRIEKTNIILEEINIYMTDKELIQFNSKENIK